MLLRVIVVSDVSSSHCPVKDQREERLRAVVCRGQSLPATHVLVTSPQCHRGEDGRRPNLCHLRVLGDRGGVEEVGAALSLPYAKGWGYGKVGLTVSRLLVLDPEDCQRGWGGQRRAEASRQASFAGQLVPFTQRQPGSETETPDPGCPYGTVHVNFCSKD